MGGMPSSGTSCVKLACAGGTRACIFHALYKFARACSRIRRRARRKNESLDARGSPLVGQRLLRGRNLLKVVKDERSCTSLCAQSACPQSGRPAPASLLRFLVDHRNFGSLLRRVMLGARGRARVHPACVRRHLGAPWRAITARIGPSIQPRSSIIRTH